MNLEAMDVPEIFSREESNEEEDENPIALLSNPSISSLMKRSLEFISKMQYKNVSSSLMLRSFKKLFYTLRKYRTF